MNPQLTIAMAKANQDEFLRRAAQHARLPREPRAHRGGRIGAKLAALMGRTASPVGKVAGAQA